MIILTNRRFLCQRMIVAYIHLHTVKPQLLPLDIMNKQLLNNEPSEIDLTAIEAFFKHISPSEFSSYLTSLTSDAMLGSEDNSRKQNSNRVNMMSMTIELIAQLRLITNKN